MITTVQRWGNSLAVRIPKAFAEQAELDAGTEMDIAIEGKVIVLRPPKKEWKLADLVKGITPSNRHGVVDWGRQVGKEVW